MRRRSALWIAVAALALGAIPLGLLAYFSISLTSTAVRSEVQNRVEATASIAETLVQSDMDGLTGVVGSYASRPTLVAFLERPRRSGALSVLQTQLRELRDARPGIATTFLADPDGRVIAIEPVTPSIVGGNFSFRDWYRGVRRTGRPYVSHAYVSRAAGHPAVVAAAVPMRSHGHLIGILVAAYRIGHIQSVVDRLSKSEHDHLTVTDQAGTLLARPAGPTRLVSWRRRPAVAAALAGRSGVTTIHGPRGDVLAAYRPIPRLGWTVSSSVPTHVALARVDHLRGAVVGVAVVLASLLLLGAIAIARALWRRERAEAELVRQVGISRSVLDGVREGITMVDLEGRTVVANARVRELTAELFGAAPEAVGEEQITESLAEPQRFLEALAREQADPHAELLTEHELAGSRRCFVRSSAPVVDDEGALLGRMIAIRETTAEREAERLKSELVATVSHELRTPLTGILGFAELLRRPDLDAATRERYAATIHTEAGRLTQLVDEFLDLQRIEAAGLTLSLEVVDLGEVVRSAVDVFCACETHPIELDLPVDRLEVAADPARLAQVLANLVSNAIKYSPAGGVVRVCAESAGGRARVSVHDRGIGIADDQRDHLFSKFFRVDSSDTRSIGGTGLGLALAREIVEAHGGRIGFDSVAGEGSTFWFELPLGERVSTSKPRALVVEDDPWAAELLVTYLRGDFDVEVAASGITALERARRRPPAVVCLDIGLPGELSGWQVIGRLKGDPRTAHVPIVVCSGQDERRRALALGAADFLPKPVDGRVLLNKIAKLLPGRAGNVLVVDDDATVRQLVASTLEEEGHAIREAPDGQEALAAIRASRPDAIVLDLVLPDRDGFEILEELSESAELRTIPVLVLTALRLSEEERAALESRAISLLEKSDYSPAELRRLIRQALAQRPLAAA